MEKALFKNKLNNLSPCQTIVVGDCVRDNIQMWKDNRETYTSAAQDATDDVGFLVTRSNIETIIKGLGLSLKPDPKPKTDEIEDLRKRLEQFSIRITHLENWRANVGAK